MIFVGRVKVRQLIRRLIAGSVAHAPLNILDLLRGPDQFNFGVLKKRHGEVTGRMHAPFVETHRDRKALTRNSRSSRLKNVPAPKKSATGASTEGFARSSHVMRSLARPNSIAAERGTEKLIARTTAGASSSAKSCTVSSAAKLIVPDFS